MADKSKKKNKRKNYVVTPKELLCLSAMSTGLIPQMPHDDFARYYDTVFNSFWEDFLQRMAVFGYSFALNGRKNG